MKNTIKMSLVAALAVAGLSTTASAGGLEEAIKGVSISGKMEVEYDYAKSNSGMANAQDTTADVWDIDWDMTMKVPVNDYFTAVLGAQADTEVGTQETTGTTVTGGAPYVFTKTTQAESQINDDSFTVTKLYFQYANAGVTAMVGKQSIGAPWFDDERANGVKALYNVGPVTLAAAHFSGANASPSVNTGSILNSPSVGSEFAKTQISAVAAIGSVGPVNFQAWYAQLSGISDDAPTALGLATVANRDSASAKSYILMADAKFDIVNVSAKYGKADYNLDNPVLFNGYNPLDDDAEMIQLVVSADLGVATPYVGMGMTDSKQGGAGLDLTSDTDSVIDFGSEQLSIDDLDNAEAFIVGVTVPVGKLTLNTSYVFGDYDSYAYNTVAGANLDLGKTTAKGSDFNEFLIEADYKMSKNFTIGGHYSIAEIEYSEGTTIANATQKTMKMDAASVSLEYKF